MNVGCIPSKSLLESSKHYHHAKDGMEKHGVICDNVRLDLDKMHQAKADSIKGLTGGIEGLFKKNKVGYSKGWGKLTGSNEVTVSKEDGSTEVIKAKNIILAMGSEVAELPPVPVDNSQFKIVDSTGALDLPKVPESMVVVGGGVIGLEMGSVWSRLGAKVTVIEFLPQIGGGLDSEITKNFQRILKKQGFKFMLNTKVTASEVQDNGMVKLTYVSRSFDHQHPNTNTQNTDTNPRKVVTVRILKLKSCSCQPVVYLLPRTVVLRSWV